MRRAKIDIYTQWGCPYCARAKALLAKKQAAYNEIDVTLDSTKRREMAVRGAPGTTVPQIFINNVTIGGCDDLYALDAAGKLDPLLRG